jgi:hypothetical protein
LAAAAQKQKRKQLSLGLGRLRRPEMNTWVCVTVIISFLKSIWVG